MKNPLKGSKEDLTFAKYAEDILHPSQGDYSARKFERFMSETHNVACMGCGETALDEYVIVNYESGMMQCPRCFQTTDLKIMMRSWLDITGSMNDA